MQILFLPAEYVAVVHEEYVAGHCVAALDAETVVVVYDSCWHVVDTFVVVGEEDAIAAAAVAGDIQPEVSVVPDVLDDRRLKSVVDASGDDAPDEHAIAIAAAAAVDDDERMAHVVVVAVVLSYAGVVVEKSLQLSSSFVVAGNV